MEHRIPALNPWDTCGIRYQLPWDVHHVERDPFGRFNDSSFKNTGFDLTTKLAALEASPFVVSLTSYTSIQRLFMCSGIIVNSNGTSDESDDFCTTILTSASLLKCPTRNREIANDIKVDVILADGTLHEGKIVGYDFHYNVAAISIKSDTFLKTAIIGNIDGSTEAALNPDGSTSFQLVRHRDRSVNLSHGMDVIALGRYYAHPHHIMGAPGAVRLVDCDLDCGELLMADCVITKVGIGGPIITGSGLVIGMSFHKDQCTPFLPINIALKCLEQFLNNRKVPHPWLGVKLSDLDTLGLSELEKLYQTFPKLLEGVVVNQIELESPASLSGLCTGDVIIQLDEKPLKKALKFKSLLLDKAYKPVKVIVKRPGSIAPLTLELHSKKPRKVNRWPLPDW